MNGHKFGAVRKSGFHLYFVNHLGDPFHDLAAIEQSRAVVHKLGHGFAIPGTLKKRRGKVGNRLRMIQFQSAREAPFRN